MASSQGPAFWRLGCAVAASLLLHGVGLWWLVFPALAVRTPVLQPRQAMAVLWIAAPAEQAAAPTTPPGALPEPGGPMHASTAVPLPGPPVVPAAPRAGTLTEQEWQNVYFGRVTRVETEAGVYCVRLPPADRLSGQRAAPRVATVTNC